MRHKSRLFIAVTALGLVALDCTGLEDAAVQLAYVAAEAGRGLVGQLDPQTGEGGPNQTPQPAEPPGAEPAVPAAALPAAATEPPTLRAVAPLGPQAEPTADEAAEWGEVPAPADEEAADPQVDEEDGAADAAGTGEEAGAGDDEVTPPPGGDPVLASVARETWIFAEPSWRSRRLGYLRAGAVVPRHPEAASHRGCKRGWYRIEPRGYVCVNSAASLDPGHPVVQLAGREPNLASLPYLYALSRYPTPPLYARLPTEKQQRHAEPSLDHLRRKYERLSREPDFVPPPDPDPTPALLQDGQVLPGLDGVARGPSRLLLGQARVRSGFALLATYEQEGRRFGLTTELALLPLDRMRVVEPSSLRGVHLSDEFPLPLGIVTSRFARRYQPQAGSGALAADPQILPWRSSWSLTGAIRRHQGEDYLELGDGSWLRADQVVRVMPFTTAPGWARQGKKWIDVSILRQTLVAYEGERPVFATLVSTGADGIADHEKTHATIQGTFLIHTKHLSVTMDGDEQGDEFDLRDVPYVQYFTDGYALHGAYWHDDFGRPRSHGCVNLAPADAAWLFRWTDPEVPKGWHAALSLKHGTVVYIHP